MATSSTVTLSKDSPRARHRLLVCLDLSEASEVCVSHAISLAKTFGSEVTLLHVMQPSHDRLGPQASDVLGWEISRQEARGYLSRVQAEITRALGQKVDARIEQGRPAERIADVARELAADLTVIAGHGTELTSTTGLGSTAQRVLALLRGSVFVAHSSPSLVTELGSPKRILVPLDGSLRTECVLPAVARIASAHGSEILLVHVVQAPAHTALLSAKEDIELAQALTSRLESAARVYLDHLRSRLAVQGTVVRTLVSRHASEHQSLLEIARHEQTDLIVLSAHGSACDSEHPYGSVTTFFLTHSTVPLLVLQDLPELTPQRPDELDLRVPSAGLRASYASESV